MNRIIFALILVLLPAVSSFAEDSNNGLSRTSPIKRSMSGGSHMADSLGKNEKKAEESDASRARVDIGKVSESKKSSSKKRVPLARSGGSPSASFAVLDSGLDK